MSDNSNSDIAKTGASASVSLGTNIFTKYLTKSLVDSNYVTKLAAAGASNIVYSFDVGVNYLSNYIGDQNVNKASFQTQLSVAGGLIMSGVTAPMVAGAAINHYAGELWDTWEIFATEYPEDFLNFIDDPLDYYGTQYSSEIHRRKTLKGGKLYSNKGVSPPTEA